MSFSGGNALPSQDLDAEAVHGALWEHGGGGDRLGEVALDQHGPPGLDAYDSGGGLLARGLDAGGGAPQAGAQALAGQIEEPAQRPTIDLDCFAGRTARLDSEPKLLTVGSADDRDDAVVGCTEERDGRRERDQVASTAPYGGGR